MAINTASATIRRIIFAMLLSFMISSRQQQNIPVNGRVQAEIFHRCYRGQMEIGTNPAHAACYRIGEFASLSGISVKTLRFYDEIGLLRPAGVDVRTRYRRYAPSQLR